MESERTIQIGKYKIEEFYWHGDFPVYVNNHFEEGSFDSIVDKYKYFAEKENEDHP